MKDTYFTIAGMNHYYGTDILKKGAKVKLIKEPDNECDREAIRVERKGLGKIGYVANSTYTVLGESCSAGRLYDRIGKKTTARVAAITPRGVVCRLQPKDAAESTDKAPKQSLYDRIAQNLLRKYDLERQDHAEFSPIWALILLVLLNNTAKGSIRQELFRALTDETKQESLSVKPQIW